MVTESDIENSDEEKLTENDSTTVTVDNIVYFNQCTVPAQTHSQFLFKGR